MRPYRRPELLLLLVTLLATAFGVVLAIAPWPIRALGLVIVVEGAFLACLIVRSPKARAPESPCGDRRHYHRRGIR